jgi:hypothetical protein
MEDEWRYRYGHSSSKRHKSAEIIEKLETPIWLSNIEKTSPALAMPDKYKSDNPIQSYRNLYIYEKIYDKSGRLMCVWRKRGVPDWYAEGVKTVPGHPLAN